MESIFNQIKDETRNSIYNKIEKPIWQCISEEFKIQFCNQLTIPVQIQIWDQVGEKLMGRIRSQIKLLTD